MGNEKTIFWLKVIASIGGIWVPLLYLIGYYYQVGYLSIFNTPQDFFIHSLYDYIIQSFYVIVQGILKLLDIINHEISSWLRISVGISIIVLFGYFIAKNEAKIKKNFPSWIVNDYSKLFFITMGGVFTVPIMFVFALFFIILIPFGSFRLALSDAKNLQSKFQECDLSRMKQTEVCTVLMKEDKVIAKGQYITGSQDKIAIWDGVDSTIYTLTNNKIIFKHGKKEDNK